MIQKVRLYPDPVLKKGCSTIDGSVDFTECIQDLKETFWSLGGHGLAAPQIGKPWRILVCHLSVKTDETLVMINPYLVESWDSGGMERQPEMCFSLPGVRVSVPRLRRIFVNFENEVGEHDGMPLEGLDARIVQHEMAHLEGRLMWDDSAVMSRKLEEPRFLKWKARYEANANRSQSVHSA